MIKSRRNNITMMFWALAWTVLLLHLNYVEGSCKLHNAKWLNEFEGPSISQPSISDPTKLRVDWSNMLQNQRCIDGYVVHLWKLLQSESQARKVRVPGPITSDTNSFIVDVVPCVQYVFRVEFEQRSFWTSSIKHVKSGTTTSSTGGLPTIKDIGKHNFDVRLLFNEQFRIHDLTKAVVSFNKSAVLNYPDCANSLKIIGNLDAVANYADDYKSVYGSSIPIAHNGSGVGGGGGSFGGSSSGGAGQTYDSPGAGRTGGVLGTKSGAGEDRASKSPDHDPRDYQQSVRVKREATYYGSSSVGEAGRTFGTQDDRYRNQHNRGGSSVGEAGRTFGTQDDRDRNHYNRGSSSVGETGRTFGTYDRDSNGYADQSTFYGYDGFYPENYDQQSGFNKEWLNRPELETAVSQNWHVFPNNPYPDNDDRGYSYNDGRIDGNTRPDYSNRYRGKREVGKRETGRNSYGSQGDTLNSGYSGGGDHPYNANDGSQGYFTDSNVNRDQGSSGRTLNNGDDRGSTGTSFGNRLSQGAAVRSRPDRRRNGRRSSKCDACRNRGKREAMPTGTEQVGVVEPPFADIVKIVVDVEPCKPYKFDLEVGKQQGSGIGVPFRRYSTDLRLPPVELQNNLKIPNFSRAYSLKALIPDSCFLSYLNAINNRILRTNDELAWYSRQSKALEHLSLQDGKGKQVGLVASLRSSSQLLQKFGCRCHMSSFIRLNTTDGKALQYYQNAFGLYRASGRFHAERPYYERKISETESYYVYYDKPTKMWYVDSTLGDGSPKLYMDNVGDIDRCPADSDIRGRGRDWYYSGIALWKKFKSFKISCGV